MQGKTFILHFAIPIDEIAYIWEDANEVCTVSLKNGTVVVAQESFQEVTDAYEEIAKCPRREFPTGGLVENPADAIQLRSP